ncbi:relaxase domain-containing protein [Leucobacter ruminantium]|uniref:Relaxase domain-containing protein n=2 Tax=Leucobacter ruminantium TaxID=1289170 RepID=A0A939LY17_9MICO|nr:relaxase domain-containing protein [Leucobacter ruminantium]
MTMSMRVMSAGQGVAYLLNSVVVGDGDRDFTEPLTRYYSQAGTPPGEWMGSGLAGLGDGSINDGDVVTEEQLKLLVGQACDPITGKPLGRPWPRYRSLEERIEHRVNTLPSTMSTGERAEAASNIVEEERTRDARSPVAAFDHTFSVPKSVSALWAVADGGTQAQIVRAHHEAIREVLDLLERDVAMTRIGADAGAGSVAQVEVMGVVAAAYDHFDSRSSDPQLHTHVVIANRVQAVQDQKWRTLDGRPIHHAVVALSEHYNAVLADHLVRDLGVRWERRERGERRNPAYEIVGVDDELIQEFSSRSHDIERETDRLIEDYCDRHGRSPSRRTIIRLRAEATLRTRPDKEKHSLAELTDQWRTRASRVLGTDAPKWATALLRDGANGVPVLLRADEVPLDAIDQVAQTVVEIVGDKRSTWRRWNLYAEAARQLMDIRFASIVDREAVTGLIVDAAERASLQLSPPELTHSPAQFQRRDGTSVFRPKYGNLFSSTAVLDAEDRLLALTGILNAPTVSLRHAERAVARPTSSGHHLTPDQADAVTRVALSGRVLDVVVGPAGTGKTTTMVALRRAWEAEHGRGSVVALAPSSAAAEVLAAELRSRAENTAKWVWEHANCRWDFEPGQLVIVDEASMVGTHTLDRITAHAHAVGAKVLVVGDPAQMDAVDASGAFGLIARHLGASAAQLIAIHRFTHSWEPFATLALRTGQLSAIQTYKQHQRIIQGGYESMLDAAYAAWLRDTLAGRTSLMIAETEEAVTALNQRARMDRITAGLVRGDRGLALHDGTEASDGDLVITRKNDRRLRAGLSWVKNGDVWEVVTAHRDGSLTVNRAGRRRGMIRLPAAYVEEHLELAYSLTAHRAQGSTVDTAHAIVHSNQMTREALYVAMTRGRDENRMYIATDQFFLEEHQHRPPEEVSMEKILAGILRHAGAEKSAHETIELEQERWSTIAQVAAEYDTIAQVAQEARWIRLLAKSGLTRQQVDDIVEGDSFGPLAAELRRADAYGYRPETMVPLLIAERPLHDAEDLGAVIRARVQGATASRTGSTRSVDRSLIVGLIPRAEGITDPDMQRGLTEREEFIESRAHALVDAALAQQADWIRALGEPPPERQRGTWVRCAVTVAAYRDRRGWGGQHPLGPRPRGTYDRIGYARAARALSRAQGAAVRETVDTSVALAPEAQDVEHEALGRTL